jgi:hypothetical protein
MATPWATENGFGTSESDFPKGVGLKWVRRKNLFRTFFQFELKVDMPAPITPDSLMRGLRGEK